MASGGDDIVDVETGGTDEAIFPSQIFPGKRRCHQKLGNIIGNDPRERKNFVCKLSQREKAGDAELAGFLKCSREVSGESNFLTEKQENTRRKTSSSYCR